VTHGLASIVVTMLALAGYAGQATTPKPQHVPLTLVDGAPPPGIDVPGAHWIKIRGAGGVASAYRNWLPQRVKPARDPKSPAHLTMEGGVDRNFFLAMLATVAFSPQTASPNTLIDRSPTFHKYE